MSIPGTTPSPEKIYPGSVDQESKNVFDMSVNNTAIYGSYSVGAPSVMEGVDSTNSILPEEQLAASVVQQINQVVSQTIDLTTGNFLNEVDDQLNGGEF